MKMKKYIVTTITSVEVLADNEKLAKRVAERYENTGIYGMGSNRVIKVEDTQMIKEIA